MSNIEFLHEYTEDGLNLMGVHWNAFNKDLCVVCIHGMSGNIIDNYFAEVLGKELSEYGNGFIFGHNRGHSHIADFIKKDGNYVRIGAAYEIFKESFYDVDLWVNKALELGYKRIVLMGHSIGSNKVIYYLSNINNSNIKSVILASPSDMVGDLILYEKDYNKLIKEAKANVEAGYSNKLLNKLIDEWFITSSKTFLDSSIEGVKADNLPILRNPEKFEQLSKINVPMLVFYGSKENDDKCNIEHRMNVIREKAINCPKVDMKILSNADHIYQGQEKELAKLILDYIKD